jgi:hypothetical protein
MSMPTAIPTRKDANASERVQHIWKKDFSQREANARITPIGD